MQLLAYGEALEFGCYSTSRYENIYANSVVENNYLSVSEKTEFELAKQTLQNSKDPQGKIM